MKSFYQRVQTQYQKLQTKINKALESGRFYEFSKFKQERLWARLQRCRLQLKHLATGAAVAAALLVTAPSVMAQYIPPPFLTNGRGHADYTSITSTSALGKVVNGDFVDLDNDGDMDYVTTTSSRNILYYENTGGIDSAAYTQRTGTANPFDGFIDCLDVKFVDIDGDGDQDCFAGCTYFSNASGTANFNQGIWYIENQGDASNPNFSLMPNTSNPIPDAGNFFANSATATIAGFVDFDGDGDQDCFVSGYDYYNYADQQGKIIYMRNDGSATNPNFTRLNSTLNPFDRFTGAIRNFNLIRMQFVDMDGDGDQDVFWSAKSGDLFTNRDYNSLYYINLGGGVMDTSITSPIDSLNTTNTSGGGPLLQAPATYSFYQRLNGLLLVDDQNDGDLDAITVGKWYENLDTVRLMHTMPLVAGTEDLEQVTISPNPAKDWLQFDQTITGIIGIYDQTGRLMLQKELEQANGLNLADLPNGLYFLYWRDEKCTLQEKVQVQR